SAGAGAAAASSAAARRRVRRRAHARDAPAAREPDGRTVRIDLALVGAEVVEQRARLEQPGPHDDQALERVLQEATHRQDPSLSIRAKGTKHLVSRRTAPLGRGVSASAALRKGEPSSYKRPTLEGADRDSMGPSGAAS